MTTQITMASADQKVDYDFMEVPAYKVLHTPDWNDRKSEYAVREDKQLQDGLILHGGLMKQKPAVCERLTDEERTLGMIHRNFLWKACVQRAEAEKATRLDREERTAFEDMYVDPSTKELRQDVEFRGNTHNRRALVLPLCKAIVAERNSAQPKEGEPLVVRTFDTTFPIMVPKGNGGRFPNAIVRMEEVAKENNLNKTGFRSMTDTDNLRMVHRLIREVKDVYQEWVRTKLGISPGKALVLWYLAYIHEYVQKLDPTIDIVGHCYTQPLGYDPTDLSKGDPNHINIVKVDRAMIQSFGPRCNPVALAKINRDNIAKGYPQQTPPTAEEVRDFFFTNKSYIKPADGGAKKMKDQKDVKAMVEVGQLPKATEAVVKHILTRDDSVLPRNQAEWKELMDIAYEDLDTESRAAATILFRNELADRGLLARIVAEKGLKYDVVIPGREAPATEPTAAPPQVKAEQQPGGKKGKKS